MATSLGPNTNAPLDILSPDCIVCAGEDRDELLAALGAAGLRKSNQTHAYRSYGFWKFDACTVVLSGIGTGCVEPLLWEVLRTQLVRRIVLVGTAGAMPGARVEHARAYAIDRAWSAGTGLDAQLGDEPVRPRWALDGGVATRSSVSADFFYGFAPVSADSRYPALAHVRELYDAHVKRGTELVEMEVAQFYWCCGAFASRELKYVAVKAVSNVVGDEAQQSSGSREALQNSVRLAMELLRERREVTP